MSNEILFTVTFLAFIIFVLLVDLVLVGRKVHVISAKEALIWSIIWITLGISFYFFLTFFGHLLHGIKSTDQLKEVIEKYNPYLQLNFSQPFDKLLATYRKSQAVNYLSGYFIEKTLSIDNIFVMLMILQGFSVPERDYKKILFWGILGAIVLRFAFIFAGVAIIRKFEWTLLLFGVFLFEFILLLDDIFEQPHMGVIALLGDGKIPVPVGQKARKPDVLEHLGKFFIHRYPRRCCHTRSDRRHRQNTLGYRRLFFPTSGRSAAAAFENCLPSTAAWQCVRRF